MNAANMYSLKKAVFLLVSTRRSQLALSRVGRYSVEDVVVCTLPEVRVIHVIACLAAIWPFGDEVVLPSCNYFASAWSSDSRRPSE